MRNLATAALCLSVLAAGTAQAESRDDAAPVGPARSCASLAGSTLLDGAVHVTTATEVPLTSLTAPVPGQPPLELRLPAMTLCLVNGEIDARTGAEGRAYALDFALALPDKWNARFLYQGGGGLNGTVHPPLGAQAAGDRPALARGFAVVATDSGHKGAVFDDSFMKDQQAALNFAQDSVGRVAPIAKDLVALYYGRKASHSYFDGCSTGGREAMLSAERYPDYFDGIIAGDPAMRTGNSNMGLLWAQAAFNRAAPKSTDGKPDATRLFSPSDKKLLVSRLLDACDALDGQKDGLIMNWQACHFDPAVLTCKGGKQDDCLSAAQVDAVKTAFAGPQTKGGMQAYPRFPYDTGIGAEGPGIPGFLPSAGPSPLGPPSPALEFDVDAALGKLATNGVQLLTDTFAWTNLSGFFGHGGKIVFYHGLSDPWFSPLDTLDYYQRVLADNGGPNKARGSTRIFLAPGMGHCQGGPAALDHFDLLTATVDWVEHGKAPDQVVATGTNLPGQSRPLCAWPAHAQYDGKGDPKAAASYACTE